MCKVSRSDLKSVEVGGGTPTIGGNTISGVLLHFTYWIIRDLSLLLTIEMYEVNRSDLKLVEVGGGTPTIGGIMTVKTDLST